MQHGLTSEDWGRIERVLASHPKIEAVILFGSRAKGIHKPGSDVDLALVGDLVLNDVLDLHNDLDDLDLPIRFDLVDYRRVTDPDVLAHVNRVGVPILARAGVVWFSRNIVGTTLAVAPTMCSGR